MATVTRQVEVQLALETRIDATLGIAGVTEAVPETSEASLQLGEAVLVEVGVPMGLAIAAIHERRDAMRRLLGRPDRRKEVSRARARLKKLKQKEKS